VAQRKVIIIGAGLGGLTAALALQQRGHRVEVYEQAPQLGEIGAGITLAPNATRVLDAVGLEKEIEAVGTVPTRQGVRHYRTGEILVKTERKENSKQRYGAAYYQAHRADVHKVLVDAAQARGIAIACSKRALRVEQDEAGASAHFADGSSAQGDAIVAADGVKSVLRDALFSPEPPVFSGYLAWRAVVPMDRLPTISLEPPSDSSIGPARLFARYPLRDFTLLNVVGIAEVDGWHDEGWSIPSAPAEMQAAFAEYHPEAQTIMAAIRPGELFKWGIFQHKPLKSWVNGRITVLGDAAHAMTPFMGQGAAMAIEDAMVLARCLTDFADIDDALIRYERARLERTDFVSVESMEKGRRWLSPNTDSYGKPGGTTHRNEETLGLFEYDAVNVPL
jgi:salicylate hydroxylase